MRRLPVAVLVALTCLAAPSAQAAPVPVRSWVTTADQTKLLAAQPAVAWQSDPTPGQPVVGVATVQVDDTQRFQTMLGFGASLTDSSASVISALPLTARNALMTSLFSPTQGIGLSYLRQPLGASDFARTPYTYDDGPVDRTLSRFSIAHDEAQVVPLVKQARSLSPGLGVMLSPWSPPAWMKDGGSLYGGSLSAGNETVYAEYLSRSVQAWAADGVPVQAITVQNEPQNANSGYPTSTMSVQQQVDVISALGPRLQAASPTTQVVAWDHNWSDPSYPAAVLEHPASAPWTDGSAWHCYGGDVSAQAAVHELAPTKDVYLTECSGYDGAPDFASNLRFGVHTLLIGGTKGWARTVLPFNLALDPRHGPHVGGCTDCRGVVTVDPTTGAVTKNVEYYWLGHAAKFVRPGAVRIGTTDLGAATVESVAFLNPDGSHVLVVFNQASYEIGYDVSYGGLLAGFHLPPGSVATHVW